jgi:transmembrane sensor
MKPTENHEPGDATAIEAEAIAWLTEREDGFAPGRAAAFDSWRRRDPRHAASVAELEQVLAQLDGLAERRTEVNAHFNRVSPSPPAGRATPGLETTPVVNVRWWRPVVWSGLAAALVLGAFLGFRALPSAPGPETRYATTTAGYERARLADGSTLELNTASAARVQFTPAERRVELESGEAHFEVAHDTARPFVVSAGGVTVRAVGTAFNVRYVSGAVEVTVTEGKVAVERVNPNALSAAPTLIAANQRLALPLAPAAAPAPVIEPLAPADVRAVLSWQRRVTDFSDTPLSEVTARFNRHNVLQLVITDPALGSRRIGGMFALDDVEAFVRLLERDGIIRAERHGDTLLLRAP